MNLIYQKNTQLKATSMCRNIHLKRKINDRTSA